MQIITAVFHAVSLATGPICGSELLVVPEAPFCLPIVPETAVLLAIVRSGFHLQLSRFELAAVECQRSNCKSHNPLLWKNHFLHNLWPDWKSCDMTSFLAPREQHSDLPADKCALPALCPVSVPAFQKQGTTSCHAGNDVLELLIISPHPLSTKIETCLQDPFM